MKPTGPEIAAAIRAYAAIGEAIVESIPAEGAPGGILYAALMTTGMTLSRFESMMGVLVDAKRLVKRGQVYYRVEQSG